MGTATYIYSKVLEGYVILFPPNSTLQEFYEGFLQLYNNELKNQRILYVGDPSIISRHCKFYRRLGNKVIYEFIAKR